MPRKTSTSHSVPVSSAATPPRIHTSILKRIVVQSLLVSAITIALLSTLSFVVARSVTTQQRLFEQLSGAATAREDLFESTIESIKQRHGLLVAGSDGLRLYNANSATLNSFLEQYKKTHNSLLGITVFDARRRVRGVAGMQSTIPFSDLTSTQLVPFVDRKMGWKAVDVYSPVRSPSGQVLGMVAARYDASPIYGNLFASLGLGDTEEVTLGLQQGGEIFITHHSREDDPLHYYSMGTVLDQFVADTPMALAAGGKEGVRVTQDERGKTVLVAYRHLSSVGWGMVIKVAVSEAFSKIAKLGVTLLLISISLLALSGLFSFFSARRLTAPLLHLAEKISALKPGHWTFKRSVKTGDEVELLDHVIADLTARLKATYEKLEEKVATKTEELKRQDVRDRAILDCIQYGVIAVDAQGVITDVNPAAARYLGFRKEDLLTRKAVEIIPLQDKKGPIALDNHPVSTCLRDRASFRATQGMHLNILCRDQSILPVTLMVTPLMEGQTLLGAIIVFQDVTEERQTDYMKSDFISLASHQLRTPLSSLLWYVEILSDEKASPMTAEQKEYLSEVQKASQRMANLLDTLLRVARMDEGGMVIEKQEVNLTEVLQRLADDLKSSAKDASISTITDLPKQPIKMSLDPVLLSIVLQNLFSNAIKYSPRGGTIAFSTAVHKHEIVLSVKDTGIGIPASEQPRMFEKFFRATNIRKMTTTGTGLGLYISKRIIEDMAGTIVFVSKEGEGTTFTITLPR